jgi:small-conductance mechanosensitive channel
VTPLERALAAIGATVIASLVGWSIQRLALPRLARWAQRTSWASDDLLVASLRGFLWFWFVLGGLVVGLQLLALPVAFASAARQVLLGLAILSASWWAARTVAGLLELGIASTLAPASPMTGVVRYAVKGIVLGVGVLVLLSTLGISVAPILTTVGIGGLAVALGLQDTLANLFAGIHVTLARNVRVGDFIRLESGEEGFVEDIGWRAARVRTLPNNLVVIPNGRLAQSVVTNYSAPSTEVAVLINVGVHYASDLDHVERVVCDVGRQIMKSVPEAVAEFEPFIRYNRFGESSVDFTVILRAREYTGNFVIKHEFIKALARRFASEGIVIPFPIRALNFTQERMRRPGTAELS